MDQGRKIAVSAAILLVGLILALPFRRSPNDPIPVANDSDMNGLVSETVIPKEKQIPLFKDKQKQPSTSKQLQPKPATPTAPVFKSPPSESLVPEKKSAPNGDEYAYPDLKDMVSSDPNANKTMANPKSNTHTQMSPIRRSTNSARTPTRAATENRPKTGLISIGKTTVKKGPARKSFVKPNTGLRSRTHYIEDGDTLKKIAIKYLGDPSRAQEIYLTNQDILKSPDILPVGEPLTIVTGDQ